MGGPGRPRRAGAAVIVLAACGGGGGGPDAGPASACVGTYSMPWPSADPAELCLYPWDVGKPALALTECGDIDERCSSSGPTPDFSCLDDDPPAPPAEPAAVTMTGFVDVFSSGPSSDGARIQVFRERQLGPEVTDLDALTPVASVDVRLDAASLVDARACPRERAFMGGQCVVPTDDCAACPKRLDAVDFCWQGSCEELQRWEVRYQLANLPTNELLVVRTVGLDPQGEPQVLQNKWSPMVQYNVYLGTGDRACADADDADCLDAAADPPRYQLDANLLSSQDYLTIPTSAGLSAGVAPGHGVVAGEVHDCAGVRVQHAQVGFTPGRLPRVLVYFNGDPTKTLPRLSQITAGTDPLGLYAGLDLAVGEVEVGAIGVRDGALAEVGRFATRVWPDSVSLVRIGGGRPPR